jgi:hypothetical protein
MNNLIATYTPYLPPPLRDLPWVAHPLDGKLLLFERDSGLNVLLEGDETAHLLRVVPLTGRSWTLLRASRGPAM